MTPQGEADFKATWPLYASAIARALAPLNENEAQQLAELLDRVRVGEKSGSCPTKMNALIRKDDDLSRLKR